MKIALVYPWLPPARDAIGEHTALLARALAPSASVTILTATEQAQSIPGVTIRPAFSAAGLKGISALPQAIAADPPDWFVLQYNPYSYGRSPSDRLALNPYLPRILYALKRQQPGLRLALIVHELMPPWMSWRSVAVSMGQLGQFLAVARATDCIFFTIEPWLRSAARWFPNTPLHQLPVGSNIPDLGVRRSAARHRLGIDENTFVLGVFGTNHPTRLLPLVRDAARAVRQETDNVRILYVGTDGKSVGHVLGDLPFIDAGYLPGEDVSAHFAAMDVHLAPFKSGVSARRGSFVTGLQHGITTVSTAGSHTDAFLQTANGRALLLADESDSAGFQAHVLHLWRNPQRRKQLGRVARTLFATHFDWPVLAQTLLSNLQQISAHDVSASHPNRM